MELRDVDIRMDMHAIVVLSCGTTIFQRVCEHDADFAPSPMSLKVVASPERKYSVVLLEPNASVAHECRSSQFFTS